MNVKDVLKRIDISVAMSGMSKEEFYEKSGISSASFSQWNTGLHKPSKKKIADAAKCLNVSVEFLLYGDNKKPALDNENEPLTVDEIKKTFRGRPFEELTNILAALTVELQNTEK